MLQRKVEEFYLFEDIFFILGDILLQHCSDL